MEERKNYFQENFAIILGGKALTKSGYNLLDFKMEGEVNNHTKLTLQFEIKSEYEQEWSFDNRESGNNNGTEFTMMLNERKYFNGIVQWGGVTEQDDKGMLVEMVVYSKSEIMDREKNFRVYQNPHIKYIDIVKDLMSRSKTINIVGINKDGNDLTPSISEKLLQPLKKKIIIQYFETDWQFLIRLMSQIGLGVFNTENGSITLGFSKDTAINQKWNAANGNIKRIYDKHFRVYHKLESQDFYLLGDNIEEVEKRNFGYVTKATINYNNDSFIGEYELKPYEYIYKYIVNEKISKASIEAVITEVPGRDGGQNIAIMTVNLSGGISKTVEENKWNEEAFQISNAFTDYIKINDKIEYFVMPYNTPYSQTNTGYFCAPELGDNVLVKFKNNEESSAYVSGVINNNGNGRFSNPDVRNYTLPIENAGAPYFDLRLDTDKIKMYSRKLIDYLTDIEFKASSNDFLAIRSVNQFRMHVDENMSVTSKVHSSTTKESREIVKDQKLEIIKALSGKYDDTYDIHTKVMDTFVDNSNYLKSPSIIKKS